MSNSLLVSLAIVRLGMALPWPGAEKTLSATSTANWTPAPTSSYEYEIPLNQLFGRDQVYPVSVCGFIGGNVAAPAYCSTASSCVWNTDYSIVGCCATASSDCQFYISCIDENSPSQTADNADVYTCRGTSLCYSNTYPLNYKQWGCGAVDDATTLGTSGLDIVFTGTGEQVANGANGGMGGVAAPSSTSSLGAAQSTIVASQSSTTPTSTAVTAVKTSAASSAEAISPSASAAASSTGSQSHASSLSASSSSNGAATTSTAPAIAASSKLSIPSGAIAGGVVGGIAVIALAGSLIIFFLKKRSNKSGYKAHSQFDSLDNAHRGQALEPMAAVGHHLNAKPGTSVVGQHTAPDNHTAAAATGNTIGPLAQFDDRGILIDHSKSKTGTGAAGAKKATGTGHKPTTGTGGAKKTTRTGGANR